MVCSGQRWKLKRSREIVEIIDGPTSNDADDKETQLVMSVCGGYNTNHHNRCMFPKNKIENDYWELLEGQELPHL